VGLAVFGEGRDTQGEGRARGDAVTLEGVFLDAAPYLLGDLESLLFGEPGQDGLELVPAEAGCLAAAFFVPLADDAAYLAEQVAVGIVHLLEVFDVGHEDAQRPPLGGFQVVLELLVEPVLDEEICQVVAADQKVQGAVEVGPHGIPVRELEHPVAQGDPVPVRERPLALQSLVVDNGAFASAQVLQNVLAFGIAEDLRVPRLDLYVPDHDVRPERVAPQN
jgi:hypothetical protein